MFRRKPPLRRVKSHWEYCPGIVDCPGEVSAIQVGVCEIHMAQGHPLIHLVKRKSRPAHICVAEADIAYARAMFQASIMLERGTEWKEF